MLKIIFTIIILCCIGAIEFSRYRSLISATVLYPIMWIFSLIGILLVKDDYYELGWEILCVIILGYILFIIGFRLAYLKVTRNNMSNVHKKNIQDDYTQNNTKVENIIQEIPSQVLGMNLIIVFGICITFITIFFMAKYIDYNDIIGSLTKIKNLVDEGKKPFPYIVVVCRYYFRCAIWFLSIVYFRIPKEKIQKTRQGKNYKGIVFRRLLITVFLAGIVMFTDPSRNDILMTMLPVFFIIAICRGFSNRKIIFLLGICFVSFLMFFTMFTKFRNGSLSQNGNNEFIDEGDNFVYYLSGSIPALNQMIKYGNISFFTIDGGRGRYTFSLLMAINDRIFGTELKPQVRQDFIYAGPKKFTNTYTYYQWLGMDFGLVYALVFQLFYGILYGYFYIQMCKKSFTGIFCYAVLSYPLIMMFFEDQFLSISQTWFIILAFSYAILFICNKTKVKISPAV